MAEFLDEISDKIFLDKLRNEFRESVKGYIIKLKEFKKEGQYTEMRKIAHDIKGIAGVFGYDRGTELASDFLNNSDSAEKDRLDNIYSELVHYLEKNVIEIKMEE